MLNLFWYVDWPVVIRRILLLSGTDATSNGDDDLRQQAAQQALQAAVQQLGYGQWALLVLFFLLLLVGLTLLYKVGKVSVRAVVSGADGVRRSFRASLVTTPSAGLDTATTALTPSPSSQLQCCCCKEVVVRGVPLAVCQGCHEIMHFGCSRECSLCRSSSSSDDVLLRRCWQCYADHVDIHAKRHEGSSDQAVSRAGVDVSTSVDFHPSMLEARPDATGGSGQDAYSKEQPTMLEARPAATGGSGLDAYSKEQMLGARPAATGGFGLDAYPKEQQCLRRDQLQLEV